VTVPKGKLGMLLDDSDGNEQYPKVQTIKPGSPFEGQVKGGDFLLRIDGQDLKGVKLEVISHILAYKKNNDSRAFTFVRPQAKK
jgi:C-terminal processing protease CtpA/Prc